MDEDAEAKKAAKTLLRLTKKKTFLMKWGKGYASEELEILEHRPGLLVCRICVTNGLYVYYNETKPTCGGCRDEWLRRYKAEELGNLKDDEYRKIIDAATKSVADKASTGTGTTAVDDAISTPAVPPSPPSPPLKIAVLLTAWIDPQDVEARLQMYKQTIAWWASTFPDLDIFVVESSGEEDAVNELRNYAETFSRVTLHAFGQKFFGMNRSRRGIAEVGSMYDIARGSRFKEYTFVFKVTGRYRLPSFLDVVLPVVAENPEVDFIVQNRNDLLSGQVRQNTEVLGLSGSRFIDLLGEVVRDNQFTGFEPRLTKLLQTNPNITTATLPRLEVPPEYLVPRGGDNRRLHHL